VAPVVKSLPSKCEALSSNPSTDKKKKKRKKKKKTTWQAPVAHACNSSYLGGRDQKDHSLKSHPGKIVYETLSKELNTHTTKKGLAEWLKW
jgi:hypothetical protein